MISDHAHVLAGAIRVYAESDRRLSLEERMDLYQKVNQIYDTLYEKRDEVHQLDLMCSNYKTMAGLSLELQRPDSALRHLEQSVWCALRLDALREQAACTSALANRLAAQGKDFPDALEKQESRDIRVCQLLYEDLAQDERFRQLDGHQAYESLRRKLVPSEGAEAVNRMENGAETSFTSLN